MSETKNGAARLYLWLGIGSFVLLFIAPLCAGAYWMSNLSSRVDDMQKTGPAADAAIQEKVGDILQRQDRFDGVLTRLQAVQSADCQQFAKIETQLGTTQEVLNEAHISDLRDIAKLWQPVMHEPYPNLYHDITIPHEVQPC